MSKRFADALSEALKVTGMSLMSACERADVSYDQFKKLMQRAAKGGPSSTNVDDAVKLAHAFGVTFDEFIRDDTAALRSEAAELWRKLTPGERDILLAAERGRSAPSQAADLQSPSKQ